MSFHPIQVNLAVIANLYYFFLPHGKRHQTVQAAVDRSNDRHFFPLQQCAKHLDPLSGKKITMDICLIKDQILARIHHRPAVVIQYFRIIQPKILIKCLGFQIIFRNDQSKRKLPEKPIGKMSFLGVQASGNLYDSRFLQLSYDRIKIGQFI